MDNNNDNNGGEGGSGDGGGGGGGSKDGFARAVGERDGNNNNSVKKNVPAAAVNSLTTTATIAPDNDHRTRAADHHDPSSGQAGGGAAGRFANRMIGNVQKHLAKSETITGTLTLSLETFTASADDGVDDGQDGTHDARKQIAREGLVPGSTVLQEEEEEEESQQAYAAAKFKVAEDAGAARMRRLKEGIEVPRMLSRVQALHDRLEGDIHVCDDSYRKFTQQVTSDNLMGILQVLCPTVSGNSGVTLYLARFFFYEASLNAFCC